MRESRAAGVLPDEIDEGFQAPAEYAEQGNATGTQITCFPGTKKKYKY
jgi:hypothetical protein